MEFDASEAESPQTTFENVFGKRARKHKQSGGNCLLLSASAVHSSGNGRRAPLRFCADGAFVIGNGLEDSHCPLPSALGNKYFG